MCDLVEQFALGMDNFLGLAHPLGIKNATRASVSIGMSVLWSKYRWNPEKSKSKEKIRVL